jgi:hypothetical protein
MANSGLHGPYDLTQSGVLNNVKGVGPGAYALGRVGQDGTFYIDYVGRSDDDLAARLQQHTPERYPKFKHGFLSSAKAAFDKECALFHDFSPPDNKVHPARPRGANWSCPRCAAFG